METGESGALERLLTELSTRFTGLPVDQVDEEIERGLRLLVEFLGTDRSTLSEFSPDGTGFAHIAAWARPGLAPYLTQDVLAELPWYHAHVVLGEILRFERFPDDLSAEAVHEKEMVQRTGLKSSLTIPIVVGGRHVCVLATGAIREFREWPDHVVDRVRLIGQIFASALHRKRVESDLRSAVAALEGARGELEKHLEEIRHLRDRVESENVYLREEIRRGSDFAAIVGQPGHPRRPRAGHPGRADRQLGAAPRRDGHRQGASRPGHPRHEPPAKRAAGDRQLCGPAAEPHRERAVRPREGRLHRRHRGKGGALRAGRRGHTLPGRDRRAFSRSPGQAAPLPAARGVRAGGLRAHPTGGRADRGRDQPRPRTGHGRRYLPEGPLLPPQRVPHPRAAATGPPRGYSAPRLGLHRSSSGPAPAAHRAGAEAARWRR